MDRTKLQLAGLLVVSIVVGFVIGSERHDPLPEPRIGIELSGIQNAIFALARAVDGTASNPETNSWLEMKDAAIKIWPREGEPVTVPGDRVRATYYHAGHVLVVQVFDGRSDQASRYEYFVEPLRWTGAPR